MNRSVASVVAALAFAGAVAVAAPARGEDAPYSADEPYPVVLGTGETFSICTSGQIDCPAKAPICDDPNVAIPVDTPEGLGFQAVGPGTTLCSAASSNNLRRVFRITVR